MPVCRAVQVDAATRAGRRTGRRSAQSGAAGVLAPAAAVGIPSGGPASARSGLEHQPQAGAAVVARGRAQGAGQAPQTAGRGDSTVPGERLRTERPDKCAGVKPTAHERDGCIRQSRIYRDKGSAATASSSVWDRWVTRQGNLWTQAAKLVRVCQALLVDRDRPRDAVSCRARGNLVVDTLGIKLTKQ